MSTYGHPILLSDEQLARLCNDGRIPVLPNFLARIACGLPAAKYFPYPDTIEACAFIIAHAGHVDGRNEVTLAREVWLELSEREVTAAKTTEEARLAYYRAPNDSLTQKLAFRKWGNFSEREISEATTIDDARMAYHNSPPRSVWRMRAIRKMAMIILEEGSQ